jgi:hypothetical protein
MYKKSILFLTLAAATSITTLATASSSLPKLPREVHQKIAGHLGPEDRSNLAKASPAAMKGVLAITPAVSFACPSVASLAAAVKAHPGSDLTIDGAKWKFFANGVDISSEQSGLLSIILGYNNGTIDLSCRFHGSKVGGAAATLNRDLKPGASFNAKACAPADEALKSKFETRDSGMSKDGYPVNIRPKGTENIRDAVKINCSSLVTPTAKASPPVK